MVLVSTDLADRARLVPAVARAAREADVFLTEIKAAAVDVVAEGAAAAGRELVFCDNEPVALEATSARQWIGWPRSRPGASRRAGRRTRGVRAMFAWREWEPRTAVRRRDAGG